VQKGLRLQNTIYKSAGGSSKNCFNDV